MSLLARSTWNEDGVAAKKRYTLYVVVYVAPSVLGGKVDRWSEDLFWHMNEGLKETWELGWATGVEVYFGNDTNPMTAFWSPTE